MPITGVMQKIKKIHEKNLIHVGRISFRFIFFAIVEDSHEEQREAQTELTTPTGSEFSFTLEELAQNINLSNKHEGFLFWDVKVKSGAGAKMLQELQEYGRKKQQKCYGEQLVSTHQ